MKGLSRLLVCLLLPAKLMSQQPLKIVGSLAENGAPWSGEGKFRFAIVDAAERVQWVSHKQNPFVQEDSAALLLPVNQGRYEVVLGTAGMPPLPTSLKSLPQLKLRVWFGVDDQDLRQLAPDLPLLTLAPSAAPSVVQPPLAEVMAELRQIKTELQQIKARLNPSPPPTQPSGPQIVSLPASPRPSLGKATAPIVLVEFTDFDCGFCKRFHQQILPELLKKYVESGQLRIESAQFPLPMHPRARRTAEIVLSSGDRFWDARNLAFENPDQSHDLLAAQVAERTGFDVTKALASGDSAAALDRDLAAAKEAGITATPSFVLGRLKGDQITGERLIGAPSFDFFAGKIDALLAEKP
jgi:protein-disulfide isomerase